MTQQQTQIEATYAELRSSTTGALLSPRFGYSVLAKMWVTATEEGYANGFSDARKDRLVKEESKRQRDTAALKKRIAKLEGELSASQGRVRELAAELLAVKRGTVTA